MDDENYSVIDCKEGIKLVTSKTLNKKEEKCSLPKNQQLRYNELVKNNVDSHLWPKCPIIRILDFTGTYEERRLSTEHNSDVGNSNNTTNRVIRRKRTRKDINPETYESERHTSRGSEEKFRISNESTVTDKPPLCLCESQKTCHRLIKIVEKLEIKIEKLQATIDGIVEKLNHSEQSVQYNLDVVQQQLPYFPLYTNEAVDDLEEKLMDAEFRSILINELRKLGGKRVTDLVNKQMSFLLDISLGCTYSYYGTKEKKAFCALKLCSVIADVVRLFFPNTTNEELKEPIQTWLRHCKEKCQKKQKLEI